VETRALYSFVNQKTGELVLKGNAEVIRDGMSLKADKILYMEKKKEAFATGNVRLSNSDFILESGQIRVYLQGNETLKSLGEKDILIIAQKGPRLTEQASESQVVNQVSAVEIKFFKGQEKIEAMENVRMVQMSTDGVQLKEEMVVTGGFLEYLHKQKKALVKKDVQLESKSLGGVGQRLIYYQKNDRFYLIDRAKVFEYDEKGKAVNQIAGNKILHLLKEGRTILMGNVEGSLGYDG
tara:strand:- start:1304 stop:2017 length:714 start_codon:yes stop_codon:yes gene_type:complete